MISLSGDSILLRGREGELRPQALDDLHTEVVESLELTGRPDSSVADDLMRVVRHFAAAAVRAGRILDMEEVRALVIRALRDAGFVDAASLMGANAQTILLADSLIEVTVETIGAILAQDARFVGFDRDLLAEKTAEALAATGLSAVTAAAATEIAVSLVVAEETPVSSEPMVAGYWLLGEGDWDGMLSKSLQEMVADGRLRLHPISRLVPSVELVVDLRRFPQNDTELALLPALDELLIELLPFLEQLPVRLAALSRDVVADAVSGRLRLLGAESVATGQLKLTGGALYSFLGDLLERSSGRLACVPWLIVAQGGSPSKLRET